MGSPDEAAEQSPLMEPRVVRLLKERTRIVDFGMRREVLEEMEVIIQERRKPNRVAKRATDNILSRAQEATRRPLSDRVEKRVDEINESILDGL